MKNKQVKQMGTFNLEHWCSRWLQSPVNDITAMEQLKTLHNEAAKHGYSKSDVSAMIHELAVKRDEKSGE
jgi:hypothetical protein